MKATVALVRVYGVGAENAGSADKRRGGRVINLPNYPRPGWRATVKVGEPIDWVFAGEHLARVMVRTLLTAEFGRANRGVGPPDLIEQLIADESIGPRADDREWWITLVCERDVEWPDDEWTARPFFWAEPLAAEKLTAEVAREVRPALDVVNALLVGAVPSANTARLLERVYFRAEGKRTIRCPEYRVGNLSVEVSQPLSSSLEIAGLDKALSAARPGLAIATAVYWWARAREERDDPRARFQFAFAGLEILTNKLSKTAHEKVGPELKADRHKELVAAPPELLDNPERLPLAAKFALVALLLSPASAVADSAEFKRLKQVRDRLAHGDIPPDEALPAGEVHGLLNRYVLLALAHLSDGPTT